MAKRKGSRKKKRSASRKSYKTLKVGGRTLKNCVAYFNKSHGGKIACKGVKK